MGENTNIEKVNSFERQKNREEMKRQFILFASMIIFTILAFLLVAWDMDRTYVIPIIIVLAVIQVAFQFFYFMHMKDKGHEFVSILIYGGLWIAFVMVICFTTIIWW